MHTQSPVHSFFLAPSFTWGHRSSLIMILLITSPHSNTDNGTVSACVCVCVCAKNNFYFCGKIWYKVLLSFLACNLPSTLSIKCILILSRKHERISGQVDNKNLLHSVSGRFAFQPSLLVGVFNRCFWCVWESVYLWCWEKLFFILPNSQFSDCSLWLP